MSYHVPPPRRIVRRTASPPTSYPLYPITLASVPPDMPLLPVSEAKNSNARKFFIGLVVVVALLALLAWLNQREGRDVQENDTRPRRSPLKKQSTAQMAKNLYKRLESRGGVNESTMRSLAQLAKNA